MYKLAGKLKKCRHRLVDWQKISSSNSKNRIINLKESIAAESEKGEQANPIDLRVMESELEEALESEERYWRKKSRIKWLRWGNRNTKFFHSKFKTRNRRNKIHHLEDDEGNTATTSEGIAEMTQKYFEKLFNSSNPKDPKEDIQGIPQKIDNTTNRMLVQIVTEKEIKSAVFSINSFSALEDDGFTAKFFQFFWKTIKKDVCQAVRSFFQRGRLISDNVLIAHGFMHFLKNKSYGEMEMDLKLDMSKTYDRVEWSCVWVIMRKLGFCNKWMNWIKECVMTVSYSVTVDEGLSHMLHRGEQRLEFSGILRTLRNYEEISGQVVNMDKSSVFFSKNTLLPIRDQIATILQVPHVGNQNKYLGLPAIVQRSKRATFNYIKEKVNQKLQHWKRALLSPSEREVLIKAMATAVPLYTLSCFKLHETLLDELQ
ncbi:uncharacterized protein LOC110266792 [Arachis ipaensis]|uniref:uncharacterized protein LOC110266792 n=1 Tax=Arachis ipaensis TaxID=130454 RepID=UPI000A2B1BF9|nr:uncharacterized protein LOC110266792 [Arachis ipaensis]XP_025678266.1 uncharacterized protein LOC112778116 [Arachis hypogaea]